MSPSESTILVVDDDEMVLSSMKLLFAIDEGHRILTFTSPHEALAALSDHQVELAVNIHL